MRPVAFPTTRISQLADLMQSTPNLLSKVLEAESIKDLIKLLQCSADDYWSTHSKWDTLTQKKSIHAGSDFIHRLIINVIVPFVFYYGQAMDQDQYRDRAVQWILGVPAENNTITRAFKKEGVRVDSAADTQALYQLKKGLCEKHRCLECSFGHALVNRKS